LSPRSPRRKSRNTQDNVAPQTYLDEIRQQEVDPALDSNVKCILPIFSIVMVIGIWTAFVYGIYGMYGFNKANLGPDEPVSPPYDPLYLKTMEPYPSCSDQRTDVWRLFSVQLVHQGLNHIIGNTFILLIFGCILEALTGFWFTALVFQGSIMLGSMFHSYMKPYTVLYGSSHGK